MPLAPAGYDSRSALYTPDLRNAQAADWREIAITLDAAALPAHAVTFEHGQFVVRGGGAGSGAQSNKRSLYVAPGSPQGYSRIRSRWAGPQIVTAQRPQRGHAHGIELGADGKYRGVVVWHDVAFGVPWILNGGVWEAAPDGSGSIAATAGLADTKTFTDGSRTSNVVTLTGLPTNHGFQIGEAVSVDAADATYDGQFVITGVGATSITYDQTAANDASAGSGVVGLLRNGSATGLGQEMLSRSIAVTDAVRASGVVTATVAAGHPFQPGDYLVSDLTDAGYDGQFIVTAVTSTTVVWKQTAADDPSAGAGTISKVFPYMVESEWLPGILRARAWPDVGVVQNGGAAAGPQVPGPPPWESRWAVSWDLNSLGGGATEPRLGNLGQGLVAAHLAGSATFSARTNVAYDNLEITSLGSR
jgi:hypothetical protein